MSSQELSVSGRRAIFWRQMRFFLFNSVKEIPDFSGATRGKVVPRKLRIFLEGLSRAARPRQFAENLLVRRKFLRLHDTEIGTEIHGKRLSNGYLITKSSVPDLVENALRECDEAIQGYEQYLAQPTSLERLNKEERGLFLKEVGKTINNPIKHIPFTHYLSNKSSIFKLASHPSILEIVTAYLGVFPVLGSLRILFSPNDKQIGESQLFHVDPEGFKQVKIFIPIRDVTELNSPLTFLPLDKTQEIRSRGGHLSYQKRLDDTEVLRFVPRRDWVEFTGKRGDLAFVDTSNCYHFGSRPGEKSRYLLFLHYLSPFSTAFPVFGKRARPALSRFSSSENKFFVNYLLNGLYQPAHIG